MRQTEAWWVCSCGTKVARPGKGLKEAFEAHRRATTCEGTMGIKQVEQRKGKRA